jgi:hypothetical protein
MTLLLPPSPSRARTVYALSTQEVGISAPPQTTFYEVHNYLTAG